MVKVFWFFDFDGAAAAAAPLEIGSDGQTKLIRRKMKKASVCRELCFKECRCGGCCGGKIFRLFGVGVILAGNILLYTY